LRPKPFLLLLSSLPWDNNNRCVRILRSARNSCWTRTTRTTAELTFTRDHFHHTATASDEEDDDYD